jgi:type III restriction enzyme
MELFPFQEGAAAQIAQRFCAYNVNPLMVDRTTPVPFFQTLISITGSGKTLILADAVALMQAALPRQPIVLWLSKGRVVVWQTYVNLSSGKYADNLSGFTVKPSS